MTRLRCFGWHACCFCIVVPLYAVLLFYTLIFEAFYHISEELLCRKYMYGRVSSTGRTTNDLDQVTHLSEEWYLYFVVSKPKLWKLYLVFSVLNQIPRVDEWWWICRNLTLNKLHPRKLCHVLLIRAPHVNGGLAQQTIEVLAWMNIFILQKIMNAINHPYSIIGWPTLSISGPRKSDRGIQQCCKFTRVRLYIHRI